MFCTEKLCRLEFENEQDVVFKYIELGGRDLPADFDGLS